MKPGCGTAEPASVRSTAISRSMVLSLVGLGCKGGRRNTIRRPSTFMPTTMFWVPPVNGATSVRVVPIRCSCSQRPMAS